MDVKERKRIVSGLLAQAKAHADEGDRIVDATYREETDSEGKSVVGIPDDAAVAEARKAYEKAHGLRQQAEMLEKAVDLRAYLDQPAGSSTAAGLNAAQGQGLLAEPRQSLGTRYVDSDSYKTLLASSGTNPGAPFRMDGVSWHDLDRSGAKDVIGFDAGPVTIPAGAARVDTLGIQEPLRRTEHIRDLMVVVPTQAATITYVQLGAFDNAARPVPMFEDDPASADPAVLRYGRKPKSRRNSVIEVAQVATIAHTLDIHEDQLADIDGLRVLLDLDMVDGVKDAEDEEVLYGTGTGRTIRGIRNQAGIQTYARTTGTAGANDKNTGVVRRAITRSVLAYGRPDGIVLNPLDWESIDLEEDGQGGYRVAQSVALGAEKRLWRLDVVESNAMAEGDFLIGDWARGARLHDRRQATVVASTENRDNFEANVVTLRGESRVGLSVYRPAAFVWGSFAPAV